MSDGVSALLRSAKEDREVVHECVSELRNVLRDMKEQREHNRENAAGENAAGENVPQAAAPAEVHSCR